MRGSFTHHNASYWQQHVLCDAPHLNGKDIGVPWYLWWFRVEKQCNDVQFNMSSSDFYYLHSLRCDLGDFGLDQKVFFCSYLQHIF